MSAPDERATDREAIFSAYFRHLDKGPRDEADFWAWEAVNDAVHRGPAQEAWELVAALLLQAPDEHLGAVAAGALEDVVTRYGVQLLDVIERAAQRDARVRRALAGVWIS